MFTNIEEVLVFHFLFPFLLCGLSSENRLPCGFPLRPITRGGNYLRKTRNTRNMCKHLFRSLWLRFFDSSIVWELGKQTKRGYRKSGMCEDSLRKPGPDTYMSTSLLSYAQLDVQDGLVRVLMAKLS